DVLAAIASPWGTEMVTTSASGVTSRTAARIIRCGTGLIAGAPTGSPRPGLVTVPTPSPPRNSVRRVLAGAQSTAAVTWAPWVQSGSSPASFTTAQRCGTAGSTSSTGNVTRRPPGSPTSTTRGGAPSTSHETAALAAALAHVPVVQPVRRPVALLVLTG